MQRKLLFPAMIARVCAKCGTPQQWEMWPRCACGGEFITCQATTKIVEEPSEEHQWIKQVYLEFRSAPWTSSLLFAAAIPLTICFPPPPIAFAAVVGISSTASALRIHGALSQRDWAAPAPFYVLFAYLLVGIANKLIDMDEGAYLALFFSSSLLLNLPFAIWRRRGLRVYSALLPARPISAPAGH